MSLYSMAISAIQGCPTLRHSYVDHRQLAGVARALLRFEAGASGGRLRAIAPAFSRDRENPVKGFLRSSPKISAFAVRPTMEIAVAGPGAADLALRNDVRLVFAPLWFVG